MGYVRKVWKNRQSEYPTRRRMTAVYGQPNVYDITREEGLVTEEGSAFDQAEMNDLEGRIAQGIKDSTEVYTATFRMNGWSSSGGTWTQTVTCSGMKAAYNTSPAWVNKTGYQSTDEALHSALNQLNEGRLESMNGYIKATLYAPPPNCDVRVFVQRRDLP